MQSDAGGGSSLEASTQEIVRALRWLIQHGDLVDFDCPDDRVAAIRTALSNRGLSFFDVGQAPLTAEGKAFLEEHAPNG